VKCIPFHILGTDGIISQYFLLSHRIQSETPPMEKPIKIILAGLFFLCLLDMPYGFYQFVRFAALLGFVLLAYRAHQHGHQAEMIVYGALALLFQPFFKIALGRTMWNIVDVVVGLGLIASIWVLNNEAGKKTPSQQ
jgi:hypothetical protein